MKPCKRETPTQRRASTKVIGREGAWSILETTEARVAKSSEQGVESN